MATLKSALQSDSSASTSQPVSAGQQLRASKKRAVREAKKKKLKQEYQKEKAKLNKYSNYTVEDIAELSETKKKDYFSYLDESKVKKVKQKVKDYKDYQKKVKEIEEEKDELEDEIDDYEDDIKDAKKDINRYENKLDMAHYKPISASKQQEYKKLIDLRESEIRRKEDDLARHQAELAELTGELPEDFDPQAYKRSAIKQAAYKSANKLGGDVEFVYKNGKLQDVNVRGEGKQKTFDIEYDKDKKIEEVKLSTYDIGSYNKQIEKLNKQLGEVKGAEKLKKIKKARESEEVSRLNRELLEKAKDKLETQKQEEFVSGKSVPQGTRKEIETLGGLFPTTREEDLAYKESKLKKDILKGEAKPEELDKFKKKEKVKNVLSDVNLRQSKFQNFLKENKKPEIKAEKLELEKARKESFGKAVDKIGLGLKEQASRLSYSGDKELSIRERFSKGRDPYIRGIITMLTGAQDIGRGLEKESIKKNIEKKEVDTKEEPLLRQKKKGQQFLLGAGREAAYAVGLGATVTKQPGVLKQLPTAILPGIVSEYKYAKRSPAGFLGGLAVQSLADKGTGGVLGTTARKGTSLGRKFVDYLTGKRLPIKENPLSGIKQIGDEGISLIPGGRTPANILKESFKRVDPNEVKIYSKLTTDIKPAKNLGILTKEQKRLANVLKDTDNVLTGSASERLLVKESKREIADLDIGTKNKPQLLNKIKNEFGEENITTKNSDVSTQVSYKGKPIADIVDIKKVEGGKGISGSKIYNIEGVNILEPSRRAQGKLSALTQAYKPEKSLKDYSRLTGQNLDIGQPSLKGGFKYTFKEQAETVKPDIDAVTGQMGLVSPGFKQKFQSFITGEPFYKGRQITVGKEAAGLEQTLFISPRMRGELGVRETRFLGRPQSGSLFDLLSGEASIGKGTPEIIRFKNLDLTLPNNKSLLSNYKKALNADEAAKTRFFQKYEKYQMNQPDKFLPFGYNSSELEGTLSKGGVIQIKQKPKITYIGDSRVKLYESELVPQKTAKATQDLFSDTKKGSKKLDTELVPQKTAKATQDLFSDTKKSSKKIFPEKTKSSDLLEESISPKKTPTKVFGTPEALGTLGGFSARPSFVSATRKTSIPSINPTKSSFITSQKSRVSPISEASQPSLTSKTSQVSRTSEVSPISEVSQPSLTSKTSQPSIVSKTSQVSKTSEVSPISEVSQPSLTSPKSPSSTLSQPSTSPTMGKPSTSAPPRLGNKSQPKTKTKSMKKAQAYDVFVKEKGEYNKLNDKKTYNKFAALNLGRQATDNTAAKTFEIRKSKKKPQKIDVFKKEKPNLKKFRSFSKTKKKKYKNRFIEKDKFAIDTQGELQGVTVKGWKKRKKGVAGLFKKPKIKF